MVVDWWNILVVDWWNILVVDWWRNLAVINLWNTSCAPPIVAAPSAQTSNMQIQNKPSTDECSTVVLFVGLFL